MLSSRGLEIQKNVIVHWFEYARDSRFVKIVKKKIQNDFMEWV